MDAIREQFEEPCNCRYCWLCSWHFDWIGSPGVVAIPRTMDRCQCSRFAPRCAGRLFAYGD